MTYYEDDHDGANPTHYVNNRETYQVRTGTVLSTDTVNAIMVAGGGHCMWIRPHTADPALSVSASPTLTERSLNGAEVTLTLDDGAFEETVTSSQVTVSGVDGVAVSSVTRASATQLTVSLSFDDTDLRADATLTLTVAAAALASLNADLSTSLNVTATVSVNFDAATYNVVEGETVEVFLSLSAPSERELTVPIIVTVANSTSSDDFAGVPSTVVFSPNDTDTSFEFKAVDDGIDDDGEAVMLSLGDLPAELAEGNQGATRIEIIDDEPTVVWSGSMTVGDTVQSIPAIGWSVFIPFGSVQVNVPRNVGDIDVLAITPADDTLSWLARADWYQLWAGAERGRSRVRACRLSRAANRQ